MMKVLREASVNLWTGFLAARVVTDRLYYYYFNLALLILFTLFGVLL